MTGSSTKQNGLASFAIAMGASVLSNTGTNMTQFALIAWAYQATGSAAAAGVLGTWAYISMIVSSIFAGVLADRLRRKMLIIGSDFLFAVVTLGILLLLQSGHLSIWCMALYGIVMGAVSSIQFPAYMASVTEMVAEDKRMKANGMYQTAWSLSMMISPALAGILLAWIGFSGVLIVDVASFVIIMLTVSFLRIPQPEAPEAPGSIWHDMFSGIKYMCARMSVLGFVLVLGSFNFAYGTYEGIFRPMLLALTDNNTQIAGWALVGWGVGNVVSGVFMSMWKGPKNRVPVTLISWALCGFSGFVLGGFGRSLPIWLLAGFLQGVFNNIAIINTIGIWQSKVEPSYQGRVFSMTRLVSQLTIPVSVWAATLIADRFVDPSFAPGGTLANAFGSLLGTGTGSGMSFVLIVAGIVFGVLGPLVMFLVPAVRNADRDQSAESGVSDSVQEVTA